MRRESNIQYDIKSQPARAVWIEIRGFDFEIKCEDCHSLRGLCGLKFHGMPKATYLPVVTACEGCVD